MNSIWGFSSQNFTFTVWLLVPARDLTPVSFFFHFKAPFCRTGTTLPANTHTKLFTEVWLTTVAKIRMIESSYPPRKRSVHNFGNDLRIIVFGWFPYLKSLMPLYKFLIFFILLLVSSSSILAYRYAFFLFLKCLIASCLTLFRLSTLFRLGSCIHCILACFLWSKKTKHSVTNVGFTHTKLFCQCYKMALFILNVTKTHN